MEEKVSMRGLYRNVISYFGAVTIAISILLIVSLMLISFTQARPSPYVGMFTYLVFPAILVLGLLIFLLGMWRERRRRLRSGMREPVPLPVFDLNNPQHRKNLAITLVAGGVLAVLLSLTAYNTYLFTDSVEFCGTLCHTVMKPEYTAYQAGPHARVPCVDCHVGQGAAWYFRSKVAGVPQVFGTMFHDYPTPLPVPIKNLRPARETCERCHWPEKFFGAQLVQIPYFEHDEKNTPEQISFLMKTGGGSSRLGERAGIHWHMILNNRIYFRAMDAERTKIPWVRMVSPDGKEEIFRDKSLATPEWDLNKIPEHLMDCIDCHNRPAHLFFPPDALVDRNLASGNISRTLPWIKNLATLALVKKYPEQRAAAGEIRKQIENFYAEKYPQVLKDQKPSVEQAIRTVISLYDHSVFPEMKVNWLTYPNHIGHRNWPGCFTCHDGRHVSDSGKVITNTCTACHTQPQRGPLLPLGTNPPSGKEPWHPMNLKGKHAGLACYQCHSLGYPSILGCAECHKIPPAAPMSSMECKSCHLKEQEAKPQAECRSCHGQIGGLHKKSAHAGSDCTACHAPHAWTVTQRDTCLTCHGDKKNHYPAEFCGKCHDFRSGGEKAEKTEKKKG